MLLQIIDRPSEDRQNHSIEIVFTAGGRTRSFVTGYYPSSLPATLREDLAWYFRDYLDPSSTPGKDKSVVDRLLSHGKYMGDRLIGDDLQLMSCREEIEDAGYGSLSVSVESSRISFFEEPWETLILPDSRYILSSAVKSFTRKSGNPPAPVESTLEFDLSTESPLKLVHAVPITSTPSNAYNAANDCLRYDKAIEYDLRPLDAWQALKARLASGPVHIYRHDGPLVYRQGMFYLPVMQGGHGGTAPPEEAVSLLELTHCLKAAGCGLLILNVTEWADESSQPLAADIGLAMAAQISMSAGMPNILGFSNPTDPWTAENCLRQVYDGLFKGLPIAQAIVEARKALQRQGESDACSFSGLPFQAWPLPVHYELRPVLFFPSPQPPSDIPHTKAYADIRRKMHGFFGEFLPPQAQLSGDSVLIECLNACSPESGIVIRIHGGQGTGKTQLLHLLAFYLMRGSEWRQAFYFDYADHFYTARDIQEMIAPILGVEDAGGLPAQAIAGRCLLLLDNFEPAGDDPEHAALRLYLNGLACSRHVIVSAGLAPSPGTAVADAGEGETRSAQIATRSLYPAEQRHMASLLFKDRKTDVKGRHKQASELLDRCRGNPFLIKHVMSRFSAETYPELSAQVESLLAESKACVDTFYTWQWSSLHASWRRWLFLLSDLRGVILEMLAVVLDAKTPFEPALKLHGMLGESATGFGKGIASMEECGFTVRYPIGRVINPRCIAFIRRQMEGDEVISRHGEELGRLLSKVIARSLSVVIPGAMKKPDQHIIQNLLYNRGLWAKHLEKLWKAGDYEEFSLALSALAELLKYAGLAGELSQWALRTLAGSGRTLASGAESPELLKAWTKLALYSIAADKAEQEPVMRETAAFFHEWINSISPEQAGAQAALFTSGVQFLQACYGKSRDWQSLKTVCDIALQVYRQHEVWPLAVRTLYSLIECCNGSGDIAQARAFEHQLLHDIPFEHLPSGFAWQVKTQVIKARIDRSEFDSAQELLDQASGVSTNTPYERLPLDILQADLYYRQGKFEDAAPLYHALMAHVSSGSASTGNGDFISRRYAEIESRIGAERLSRILLSADESEASRTPEQKSESASR